MRWKEVMHWSELVSLFREYGYTEVRLKVMARQNLVPGRRICNLWYMERP